MKFPFRTPQVRSGLFQGYFPNPAGSKWEKGFTLLEVLIVIALLVLLALAFLRFFNPKLQVEKGWDSKRKKELNTLQKIFEEYYNDKSCYPKPEEVCYDYTPGSTTCTICGNEPLPPGFSSLKPYISKLPCDPQYPAKAYLYEVDNSSCPSYYRIYAKLSNENDQAIEEVGCSTGCAPAGAAISPDEAYNYGVSSPNTSLNSIASSIIQYACRSDGVCLQCCTDITSSECPQPTPCPALDQEPGYCWIVGSLDVCQANCEPGCPPSTP